MLKKLTFWWKGLAMSYISKASNKDMCERIYSHFSNFGDGIYGDCLLKSLLNTTNNSDKKSNLKEIKSSLKELDFLIEVLKRRNFDSEKEKELKRDIINEYSQLMPIINLVFNPDSDEESFKESVKISIEIIREKLQENSYDLFKIQEYGLERYMESKQALEEGRERLRKQEKVDDQIKDPNSNVVGIHRKKSNSDGWP